jgi:hypothetical protein
MKDSCVRILDISYYLTVPPISGGALRMLNPYIHMNRDDGIMVDFLFSTWLDYAERCRKYLMRYTAFKSVTGVQARHYLNCGEGRPEEFSEDVWKTMSRELLEAAISIARKEKYDIIQIEHSQLSWIVPALRVASPDSKFVLDLHNAEHLNLCVGFPKRGLRKKIVLRAIPDFI